MLYMYERTVSDEQDSKRVGTFKLGKFKKNALHFASSKVDGSKARDRLGNFGARRAHQETDIMTM